MTQQADLIRDRRRAFAAPGGAHDRMVQRLATWLPATVGAIVAMMVISPLFPRSEVSFLLDRNRVAMTEERLKVNNATYRGEDDHGRAFTVTAGQAVQHSARVPVVAMKNLVAQMTMTDGPARVTANSGDYDIDHDRMVVNGPVRFQAADGYRLNTSGLTIDLKNRRASGSGGVTGEGPSASFSADRIATDLASRVIVLDGRVRMRMVPGKTKLPK